MSSQTHQLLGVGWSALFANCLGVCYAGEFLLLRRIMTIGKPMHLESPFSTRWGACGVQGDTTSDGGKVTCLRCLKTRRFKDIANVGDHLSSDGGGTGAQQGEL